MKRLSLILLGIFLPVFAMAQNVSTITGMTIFNPPAISGGTDLSISYLGDIYGVVDGVLYGSGSQIMGQMFMAFNTGALVLGGIIVIYTTLLSLMNTAHEGEVLGKKWNSIWIPLRTVMGIALLIPKATGYCAIQIFMMWVILQGVGLADTVWDNATTYLQNGGVVVHQSQAASGNYLSLGVGLFPQIVCLETLQAGISQAYQAAGQANPPIQNLPPQPDIMASINPLSYASGCTNCSVTLPNLTPTGGAADVNNPVNPGIPPQSGVNWTFLNGACGTITWTVPSGAPSDYNASIATGLQEMLLTLGNTAQQAVDQYIFPPAGATQNSDMSFITQGVFNNASEAYEGITANVSSEMGSGGGARNTAWISGAQNMGWITAGQYYIDMAYLSSTALSSLTGQDTPTPTSTGNIANAMNDQLKSSNFGPLAPYVNLTSYVDDVTGSDSPINQWINNSKNISQSTQSYGDAQGPGAAAAGSTIVGVAGILAILLAPLLAPLVKIMEAFVNLATSQSSNANPVILIAVMGGGLMSLVVEVWIAGAVSLAGATAALTFGAPFFGLGVVASVVTQWVVPFIWAICGLIFTEGVLMAYYVPMIPYLLFLFGAIGWLMATLEAMVAAPLVALGITHPEGQEVLGKADPAVLLLVNVFLRPSMMIIGFIGGAILSYVSIWFLNVAFFSTFWKAAGSSFSLVAIIFGIPFMIIFYVIIVIALLNYSFSLINVVPDKVMRWLGGQAESIAGEAGKMAGEAKGGMEAAGKGAAEGTQALAKAAGERADKESTPSKANIEQGGGGGKGAKGGGGDGLNIG